MQEHIMMSTLTSSIETLKNLRLTTKKYKILVDKEIKRRYDHIYRRDELYVPREKTIGQMISSLSRLENEVINPAIAAGPRKVDFLTDKIHWDRNVDNATQYTADDYDAHFTDNVADGNYVRDYPTLRYLLEHGANPQRALGLIEEHIAKHHPYSRPDPHLVKELELMVVLALKHGMVIPAWFEARGVLTGIHGFFNEHRLPLPEWIPDNPNHWPEPTYFAH